VTRWLAGVVVATIAVAAAAPLPGRQRGGGPPVPAQPPGPPPTGTGLIVGQIVDAATNTPIAGAVATINTGRGGGPPGAASPPARLVTGPDGRFVLHDLPKGSFNVSATADGYIDGSAGQTRPNGPSQAIDLGDGEHLTDVKVRLWRSAVLTGTVIDDAGEPAVATPVRAYRKTAVAGRVRYNGIGYATTDDRGVYRISDLTPGDYIVAVPQTHQTVPATILDTALQGVASGTPMGGALIDLMTTGGGAPSPMGGNGVRIGDLLLSSQSGASAPASDGRVFAFQSAFFAAASSVSQATAVTVRSGEERAGVDLQLRLAPTSRVSGVVTAPIGPIGSVTVRLMPASSDDGDLGIDTATAVTRVDGSFTFLGVPPGQFIAKVIKNPRPAVPPELASNPMVLMALGGAGGPDALFGELPITVTGADVDGLTIPLAPGAKLSGRIVFDGASPPPQPQQMRSIMVTLQASSLTGGFSPYAGARPPDANGQFTTAPYPPGRYLVNTLTTIGNWTLRSIVAGGRDVTAEPIDLRENDITDAVVMYTDRSAQLSGNVRVPGGAAPAPGATVFLFPADFRAKIANADGRRFRNASVTKTGAYTFNNVPAGEYVVAVLDGDDVPENRDAALFEALSRAGTHLTIIEGEKKTQDLVPVKVGR